MRQKAYWEFPNPASPPVLNRDDADPFVDPYSPLVM